jgi:hypothetical protein
MEIVWHKLKDVQPPFNHRILISDGFKLGVASPYLNSSGYIAFDGSGFDGDEWHWSFITTHWAEIPEDFLPGAGCITMI